MSVKLTKDDCVFLLLKKYETLKNFLKNPIFPMMRSLTLSHISVPGREHSRLSA